MCASSFWMLMQSIVYSVFIMFVVFPQDALTHFVSEWSPCTFINVLASNHVIKLVNTGTSTCHSTLDRWTIGNKHGVWIDAGLVYMPGQISFIGNRCPGFYSDKYSMPFLHHMYLLSSNCLPPICSPNTSF